MKLANEDSPVCQTRFIPIVKSSSTGQFFALSNGINYFVPVSSKIKNNNNTIIIKSSGRKPESKGSLRFAYMIPIPKQMLKSLKINEIKDNNKKRLLQIELAFCRRNKDRITKQAAKTYDTLTSTKSDKLKNNSCDFKILEDAYMEFCIEHNIQFVAKEQSDALDTSATKTQVISDEQLNEPNTYRKILKEFENILESDAELKSHYENAKTEYLLSNGLKAVAAPTNDMSFKKVVEAFKAQRDEASKILLSDNALKQEFIAAKQAYQAKLKQGISEKKTAAKALITTSPHKPKR